MMSVLELLPFSPSLLQLSSSSVLHSKNYFYYSFLVKGLQMVSIKGFLWVSI